MTTRLFTRELEATVLVRKNRFVLVCQPVNALGLAHGPVVEAHLANPGRMLELLEPGSRLVLEALAPGGKLAWRVAAVDYGGAWVPLVSARANLAARDLVIPRLFPGAEVRAEVKSGSHRIDFVVTDQSSPIYIEVKACSLVEHGLAMFPDAPSTRARAHIDHLASLRAAGSRAMVLWIIMHGEARCLAANIHTDPDFAAAVEDHAEIVEYRAFSLRVDAHGMARLAGEVPVTPALPGRLGVRPDWSGSYFLGLRLSHPLRLEGKLGGTILTPGWYIYVGSAMGGVEARLSYHRRRWKAGRAGKILERGHWHIDQVTEQAVEFLEFPIRSAVPLEGRLAQALADMEGGCMVPGFGASDSDHFSHLCALEVRPDLHRPFRDILLEARHNWFLER